MNRLTAQSIPITTGLATHSSRLGRRAVFCYVAFCTLGLIPIVNGASASWRAFGLGLWFPGAGFIASGGWAVLLLPVVVICFFAALFAWFGAGMVIAPVLVWAGSAVLAAASVGPTIWTPSPYIVVALTVLAAMFVTRQSRQTKASQVLKREQRNTYLAEAMNVVALQQSATAAAQPTAVESELDVDQLASLRYVLDRALQPIDDFTGFNCIDQFQTSALRYQINQLGYALAVAQSRYTPSFHGYLSQAQRQLIDRYLQPKVLSYWRWESLWGHFNSNPDPVGRDNIMLTGYLGINLALYMGTTGDFRYMEAGSLTFPVSARQSYRHSAATVRDSLLDNYRQYHDGFCLYPCEPTWVYSGCNFRGAATLAAFDRALGTQHWPSIRDHFNERLHAEFMTPDASVVALRSNLIGAAIPFPVPDAVLPKELNAIYPELARRYWAIVRQEWLKKTDGIWKPAMSAKNIDFGNYKSNDVFVLDGFFGSAREMGDGEVAEAILTRLNESCERIVEGGALFYKGASTLANATIVMDRLLCCNGWHDAINTPVDESTLRGPLLSQASYPEVLVAKARSDGEDLRLVLYAGKSPGVYPIGIDRLKPSRRYEVRGATTTTLVADARGYASIEIELAGRIAVQIAPAS